MESTAKRELLSLELHELEEWLLSAGEAKYRAKQLFPQLHKGLSPDEMTNLGKRLQEKLRDAFEWHLPVVERKLVSKIDGTVKYLFSLADGNCVESVVMGIGEPLDNYDNVLKFLRLVNCEEGVCIGYRHISLSTCGLVDRIERLMEEDLPITLSISLHAPDDETRSAIMPINKKYGVDALLEACRAYFAKTGRRISFEYTLIAGKNDSPENALKLSRVLNAKLRSRTETMPIHVNLIPVNEVSETEFKRSSKDAVKKFAAILESKGIRATVRRKLGSDINASCGQLRRESLKEKDSATT